jgi:hypothetical protein
MVDASLFLTGEPDLTMGPDTIGDHPNLWDMISPGRERD